MLNVSKYDHLCENMAIDVLVLFLKCVKFLKSCVDTILNLALVLFLMKKKGDVPMQCTSCI
jgi:hypothetical protein